MKTSTQRKVCTKCSKRRATTKFGPNPNTIDGLQSWCRECQATYIRERRKSDPERKKRDRWITKTYNKALGVLRDRYPDEFEDILVEVRDQNPLEA